jgi:hypothetical protein
LSQPVEPRELSTLRLAELFRRYDERRRLVLATASQRPSRTQSAQQAEQLVGQLLRASPKLPGFLESPILALPLSMIRDCRSCGVSDNALAVAASISYCGGKSDALAQRRARDAVRRNSSPEPMPRPGDGPPTSPAYFAALGRNASVAGDRDASLDWCNPDSQSLNRRIRLLATG